MVGGLALSIGRQPDQAALLRTQSVRDQPGLIRSEAISERTQQGIERCSSSCCSRVTSFVGYSFFKEIVLGFLGVVEANRWLAVALQAVAATVRC